MNQCYPNPQMTLFLTETMHQAFRTACTLYLDELDKVLQLSHQVAQSELKRRVADARDRRRASAKKLWENAQRLAHLGNIPASRVQLANLLQEYGRTQALDDVWFYGPLDPNTPEIEKEAEQKVRNKLITLSGDLLQTFTLGEWERQVAMEQERQAREEPWRHLATKQMQQQTNWQEYGRQMLHDQFTYWQADHHVAQEWAGVAKSTVDQAQRGVEILFDGAGTVFDYIVKSEDKVVDMTEGFHKHLDQQLPSYVEEAQERVENRRIGRKLKMFAWVMVAFVVGVPLVLWIVAQVSAHLFPH